jgi:hypothetical protein
MNEAGHSLKKRRRVVISEINIFQMQDKDINQYSSVLDLQTNHQRQN